jgi:prepilin-type N-terminal cleavage/methylation domain-containing protein
MMPKRRQKKGFTLLELMVAVGILVVAIAALLGGLINCILLNQANANLAIAANDAQYVLEQIKESAFDNITGYTPPAFNNLDNEDVDVAFDPGSGIVEVTVDVSWTERSRTKSFSLATRIAE